MLKRVYVDNFKCLVNFEFVPDRLNLILGRNGCGKSAFLDVLARVRDLILCAPLSDLFSAESLTRWQTREVQCFELHVERNGNTYLYRQHVEHNSHIGKNRIKLEELLFGDRPLFLFREGEVQLHRDDHTAGPKYSADWGRSALAAVPSRHDNKLLTWFKEWCANLRIVAPNPPLMESTSQREEEVLARNLSNFASWYRHMQQEEPAAAAEMVEDLKEVIDGFVALKLPSAGRDSRVLTAMFRTGAEGASSSRTDDYDFDELSDGQRSLIALYALLHLGLARHSTLCIDEPDNYVSLAEIQPWLTRLRDRVAERSAQVILVSHNSEVINDLAPEAGKLFERHDAGPVRVREFVLSEGLTAAESIARGWE